MLLTGRNHFLLVIMRGTDVMVQQGHGTAEFQEISSTVATRAWWLSTFVWHTELQFVSMFLVWQEIKTSAWHLDTAAVSPLKAQGMSDRLTVTAWEKKGYQEGFYSSLNAYCCFPPPIIKPTSLSTHVCWHT